MNDDVKSIIVKSLKECAKVILTALLAYLGLVTSGCITPVIF